MFLSVIDLVNLLLSVQVTSIGIPVLSVIAAACITVGSVLDKRKYARLIEAYDLAEERRLEHLATSAELASEMQEQRLGEAVLLLGELTTLTYSLCGTDELTEAWRQEECEAWDEEYQLPQPVDGGCQELSIEVNTLHKALSQLTRELGENQSQDIDIEFYRCWVAQLHERYNQWRERKQSIAELKRLEAKLEYLEQLLCQNHDVCVMHWQYVTDFAFQQKPLDTYQDLYEFAVYKHRQIEVHRQELEEGKDLSLSTTLYAESVEILERMHELLDGEHDLFELFTIERIKAEAKGLWHDVLTYASETRSAFLQECLAESLGKYLQGFTQARRSFLDCGPCGQKKAVESYRMALVHWSGSQALMLVMREQIDRVEDFADPLTLARNEYCFDLALLGRTQQDLQALGTALQTFQEIFERSCTNFLL